MLFFIYLIRFYSEIHFVFIPFAKVTNIFLCKSIYILFLKKKSEKFATIKKNIYFCPV